MAQEGTHRIPPYWAPNLDYIFRDWERDVRNWVRLTDLDETQHGGAVYQRLGGVAKMLAREIPDDVIANGQNGRKGLDILIDALRGRWGGQRQSKQQELQSAYENFTIAPGEDYDDAITRFDVIRTRAHAEAGHTVGFTQLARKLLLAFRVPDDQWALLLAPTRGELPETEETYNAFVDYLKTHLSLFLKRSNVIHPVPPKGPTYAPHVPLPQQTYMMNAA